MESNHSGVRNSNKIDWSSDDLLGSISVKAYTCIFCKRGFSNAQALGGHMNIHRKERAKLRETADENLPAMDITRSSNTGKPHQAFEEKGSSPQDGGKELDHLLTLVDTKTVNVPAVREDVADKKEQSMNHVLSPEELDLELRLGPEPHVK